MYKLGMALMLQLRICLATTLSSVLSNRFLNITFLLLTGLLTLTNQIPFTPSSSSVFAWSHKSYGNYFLACKKKSISAVWRWNVKFLWYMYIKIYLLNHPYTHIHADSNGKKLKVFWNFLCDEFSRYYSTNFMWENFWSLVIAPERNLRIIWKTPFHLRLYVIHSRNIYWYVCYGRYKDDSDTSCP